MILQGLNRTNIQTNMHTLLSIRMRGLFLGGKDFQFRVKSESNGLFETY